MRDVLSYLSSLTMPDPQTRDMRQIRQMMSELPLVSARLSKLRILCLNDFLDGDLCKKYLLFPYFLLFFWFSSMILYYALIFSHVVVSNTASDYVTN